MAANTKETKENMMASSFKKRLDALGCPYTAEVEASWILELLCKPGEPRIRILQWLFSKFDADLCDMLDMEYTTMESKMDSRLQRLLHVASTLGLCQYDDVDLIRGATGGVKQSTFLDHLLDIVTIADAAEDPQTKAMVTPGTVSASQTLCNQLREDRSYVEKLVNHEKMDLLFNSSISLLPPDIARQVERDWVEKGFSKEKPPMPDSKVLMERFNDLVGNLQKQTGILEELKAKFDYEPSSDSDTSTVSRTLELALSELAQLMTGFVYCFENEIQPWCNKSPPKLTELGHSIKRVHTLLKQLKTFQDSVQCIKTSHEALNDGSRKKMEPLIVEKVNNQARATLTAAESFQEYISVLEESIQRETSFTSNHSSRLKT